MQKILCFIFSSFALLASEMTLEEKIGQLFMAPACPLRDEAHFRDWQKLISTYHIGGALVKRSDPASQMRFLNRLQKLSKIPILVAADAEWGLAMRMSEVPKFPRNMTLGAIRDPQLLFDFGALVGRQAKSVGVHLNFAPVADVNSNPLNPVIGIRSFGDDPGHVANCVSSVFKGLESAGVLACAKHFPGHGNTTVDSHKDLPVIMHPLDLLPFKRAIDEKIASIMTAHILVPELDPELPMTLSPSLKRLLRDELQFEGLIITDALNMKAISDRYSPEEAAILAREAGSDILLYGAHLDPAVDTLIHDFLPRAFQALKEAYISGRLSMNDLDASVERILKAKKGLPRACDPPASLFTPEAISLKKRLFKHAITLIGEPPDPTDFIVMAKDNLTPEFFAKLPPNTTLCLFASPYHLLHVQWPKTILLAYEDDEDVREAVFDILSGKQAAIGQLPVRLAR